MGKWDPKTDYGPEEALKDMLCDGPVKDVCFTETGIVKEYENGRITIFDSADNEKGHNSYDFHPDANGIYHGTSHKSNS